MDDKKEKNTKPKKEKKLSDYKYNKKVARGLLGRVRYSLLQTQILYLIVSYLIVMPAVQALWSFALWLSPKGYVTTDTIKTVFRAPSILLAIVVIAIGIAWWTLYEFSLILNGLDCAYRGEEIRLLPLLKRSAGCIKKALYPRNWLVFIYVAVLIPFTNLFLSSNYIDQLQVPEYIAEAIEDHMVTQVLYGLVIIVAMLLVLIWILSLHHFILGGKDFIEACKCSVRWIENHPIKKTIMLFRWSIRCTLVMGVLLLFPVLLGFMALLVMGIRNTDVMLALWRTWEIIGAPFGGFIIGCIMMLSIFAFLSGIYYQQGDKTKEKEENISGLLQKNKDYRKGGRIFILVTCLVVALFFGMISTAAFYSPEVEESIVSYTNPKITVTSHRGYSAVAPENTLPSFEAAIDAGADCAELDVQLTKDGVVMLTHDTNLKRTTGKDANIYDLTYDEVRKLDAGSFFSEKFKGTKVPTLQEVMDLCKGKIRLNIEIKPSSETPDLEEKVAYLIEDNGWTNDCTVTSLSYESLGKVKEVAPEIQCGYILAVGVGNYYGLKNADFFSVEATFVTQNMVSALHALGKGVSVWTIDRESDAEKVRDLGVDDIITGDVEMIQTVLSQKSDFEQLLVDGVNQIKNSN